MCKRTTRDPLIRWMLDEYGLNLLRIPRRDVSVGDLFIVRDERASTPARVESLFDPPIVLPEVTKDEPLADVSGRLSSIVSWETGISFVEGFWSAFAKVGGFDFGAALDRNRARGFRFSFRDVTRDSVDALECGATLAQGRLELENPLLSDEHRYYVSTAVVRARTLEAIMELERDSSASLNVKQLQIAGTEVGIDVQYSGSGRVSFTGAEALGFGIELYELVLDPEKDTLSFRIPENYVPARTAPWGSRRGSRSGS